MVVTTRAKRSISTATAGNGTAGETKHAKKPAKKASGNASASKERSHMKEQDPSSPDQQAGVSIDPSMAPPAKKARRGAQTTSKTQAEPESAVSKSMAAASDQRVRGPVPLSRPADPAATNAPLATPRGSRHTAYPLSGPAPAYLPKPRANTSNILEQACSHLCKADPRMQLLIDAHPCPLFTPEALAEPVDPFKSLVSGILAQQVSGAAAASIKRKFVALFNPTDLDHAEHTFPTPAQVVPKDIATLRTAGLSQHKAEYVSGLAQKFVDGELSAEILAKASWEEVLEKLTAVRGLGIWSVEMFGCFALKRMDIFSTGDLGVQRGLAAFIGRDVKKLKAKGGGKWKYMSEKEMLEHSAKFAPYRTLFMWYMWRAEDVNVDAMQNS